MADDKGKESSKSKGAGAAKGGESKGGGREGRRQGWRNAQGGQGRGWRQAHVDAADVARRGRQACSRRRGCASST